VGGRGDMGLVVVGGVKRDVGGRLGREEVERGESGAGGAVGVRDGIAAPVAGGSGEVGGRCDKGLVVVGGASGEVGGRGEVVVGMAGGSGEVGGRCDKGVLVEGGAPVGVNGVFSDDKLNVTGPCGRVEGGLAGGLGATGGVFGGGVAPASGVVGEGPFCGLGENGVMAS